MDVALWGFIGGCVIGGACWLVGAWHDYTRAKTAAWLEAEGRLRCSSYPLAPYRDAAGPNTLRLEDLADAALDETHPRARDLVEATRRAQEQNKRPVVGTGRTRLGD